MYYSTIETGTRIRNLRKDNGLTQAQLAEKINISDRYLQKLETGERGGSVDILVGIACVFNVSLDFLILGKPQTEEVKSQLIEMASRIEKLAKNI